MEPIDELAGLIRRHAPTDGTFGTALDKVSLIRSSAVMEPIHTLYEPSLCLVAGGRKRATLGGQAHVYDAAHFLVVGVDLPVIGAVIEASATDPYLCMRLELDRAVLADLLLAQGKRPPSAASVPALALSEATPDLIGAAVRLLRLLDAPDDAPMLAPLVEREILYRLLTGPQGEMVRQIASSESRLSQVARAIAFIRTHYATPFPIERLAAEVGMSESSFYAHFRAVTSMSPLQFRTRIRLQEARRLMVQDRINAADAGFRVGYDSPSQFSRDYARLFGASPLRDVSRLRADGVAASAA